MSNCAPGAGQQGPAPEIPPPAGAAEGSDTGGLGEQPPPVDAQRLAPWAVPIEQGPSGPGVNDPAGRQELPLHSSFEKQPGGWTLCRHPEAAPGDLERLQQLVAAFDVPGAQGLFARSLQDLSGYRGGCPPVEINLGHDRSIYEHPRRHTPAEYAIMDQKCEQLREAGLIVRAPPEA